VSGVVVVTSSAIVCWVVVAQGVGAEMADDGVAALFVNATDDGVVLEMTGRQRLAVMAMTCSMVHNLRRRTQTETKQSIVAALLANETDDDEMTGRQRLAVLAMTCPMIHNLRRRTQTRNPNQP
jgi:hypothetical protein